MTVERHTLVSALTVMRHRLRHLLEAVALLLVVGVLPITTGCGGRADIRSAANTTRPTKTPRQEASAFLRELRSFEARAHVAADEGLAIAKSQRQRCPATPQRPSRELEERIEDTTQIFSEAIVATLAAPAYEEFSNKLLSLEPRTPALRTIANQSGFIATEAAKLPPKLDFCSYLADWKRSGWSREVEHRIIRQPLASIVDRKGLSAASDAAFAAQPQLEQIMTSDEAAELVAGVTAFL